MKPDPALQSWTSDHQYLHCLETQVSTKKWFIFHSHYNAKSHRACSTENKPISVFGELLLNTIFIHFPFCTKAWVSIYQGLYEWHLFLKPRQGDSICYSSNKVLQDPVTLYSYWDNYSNYLTLPKATRRASRSAFLTFLVWPDLGLTPQVS